MENEIISVDVEELFSDSPTQTAEVEKPKIDIPKLVLDSTETDATPLKDTNLRFRGAGWFEDIKEIEVLISGLGGIGSGLAFQVSRLCVKSLMVNDMDIVEEKNLSGQLYGKMSFGVSKVEATRRMCFALCDYTVDTRNGRIEDNSQIIKPITLCGYDSMPARKICYQLWKNLVSTQTDKSKCLFVDGRMSAEEFQIFTIKGDDTISMDLYEKEYLFDASEAEATVCSYKQTTFVASMIGGFMANILVNFVSNFKAENEYTCRTLPFFTYYNAQNMFLKLT